MHVTHSSFCSSLGFVPERGNGERFRDVSGRIGPSIPLPIF